MLRSFADKEAVVVWELGISQYRLATEIGVPPRRINEIVHGTGRTTANTALRLARYFGASEPFFLNLRDNYDLEAEKERLGATLEQITPLKRAG